MVDFFPSSTPCFEEHFGIVDKRGCQTHGVNLSCLIRFIRNVRAILVRVEKFNNIFEIKLNENSSENYSETSLDGSFSVAQYLLQC